MKCRCNDREHDTMTALWHGAYCRWYDHRDRGHEFRGAAWGWIADRLVRWVR
jgi:hypothetical protein